MSFYQQLQDMQSQWILDEENRRRDMQQKVAHNFKSLPHDEKDYVAYDKLKLQISNAIKKSPESDKYIITMPKSLSACLMLIEMLKNDGIHNFEINNEGLIFTRVMVHDDSDMDDDPFFGDCPQEVLSHRTITLCRPFDKPSF